MNLPIWEVSNSASHRAQDQVVRFHQAIEVSAEVTRNLGSDERDLACRQAIAFVFHPTPLQASTSVRTHQDQARDSTLNANAPVWEKAGTSSLRGTAHPAFDSLTTAQGQRHAELCDRLMGHNDDMNSQFVTILERQVVSHGETIV
jgi:hypothetical protein